MPLIGEHLRELTYHVLLFDYDGYSVTLWHTWAPSDEGDSSQCEEMSRSDRGDRHRQRLSANLTEGEKIVVFLCEFTLYCELFYYLSLRLFATQKSTSLVRGRQGVVQSCDTRKNVAYKLKMPLEWGAFQIIPYICFRTYYNRPQSCQRRNVWFC